VPQEKSAPELNKFHSYSLPVRPARSLEVDRAGPCG
jgi:hypothetical protein